MPINFDHHKVELNWGGQPLTLETGKIARQADGAVLATLGETVLLATVVSAKSPKPGQDFFPLTVNYQEKYFAAGKIPGGYFKREGRPTENETLTSRLIDRPIRPLFPDGYKNETQVIVTVLQHDMENNPDVLSMVDLCAADPDVRTALVVALVRLVREQGGAAVRAEVLDGSPACRMLEGLGFLRREQSTGPFVVGGGGTPSRAADWWMTEGDRDI